MTTTPQDPIVIVGAARTPMGSLQGDFSSLAAHDLGGAAIKAALERAGVQPAAVGEVLFGNSHVGSLVNLLSGDADAAVPIIESEQRIDLMISDVGLPGMNGRQLAEIGRQIRPDLKVLFITGYAEHAAVRGCFLDPGMQLITKPFTFELLTAKVREMIQA